MAVLSRDEYFERLHARLGEDNSDDAIAFLEDMSDTYEDMEQRANGGGEDWERRYHELDEAWKARYRHRFFSGDTGKRADGESEDEKGGYDAESVTVDELFKEE